MSHSFKLKFDQIQEDKPVNEDIPSDNHPKAYEEFYREDGHSRNVCFVWLDGKRIFMNYGFLISGVYSPVEDIITLSFTTQIFVLHGVNLESLFYDLMHHTAKQITCKDKRYNLVGENEVPVVNEIKTNNM